MVPFNENVFRDPQAGHGVRRENLRCGNRSLGRVRSRQHQSELGGWANPQNEVRVLATIHGDLRKAWRGDRIVHDLARTAYAARVPEVIDLDVNQPIRPNAELGGSEIETKISGRRYGGHKEAARRQFERTGEVREAEICGVEPVQSASRRTEGNVISQRVRYADVGE